MARLRDKLFGRALRTDEEQVEQIGPLSGVPVLGLDALASASYGPEAALTSLIAVQATADTYIISITGTILVLLVLLSISYHQTIAAYPKGGGAFTVAKENVGPAMAQIAASALCVDYILNAAVAISAGVGFSDRYEGRPVIVLIPELVHRRWYQFIINHRATRLKAKLLLEGNASISVMSTPWYPSTAGQPARTDKAA